MFEYLLAFAASCCFVALKSTQQLNVQHRAYIWIIPTSLLMASTEVYVMATVARTGYGWLVVAIGLGAGLGAVAATYLHNRFIQKRTE